jgi:hypothetical protein
VSRVAPLALLLAVACVPARAPSVPSLELAGTDGARHAVVSPRGPTVLFFFSAHCSCQTAHDGRYRALYEAYHPRGVGFFAIDSEDGVSLDADVEYARARGYPFPILRDDGARLARAVGAEFATYSLVVAPDGKVLYKGGIDSDRTTLRSDARAFLKDALDDALAGAAPRVAEGEVLGCALRLP